MLRSFFQDKYDYQATENFGLLERQYKHQVAQNHIQFDNTQLEVLQELQEIIDRLML